MTFARCSFLALLGLGTSVLFLGCTQTQTDADKVAEAQACLDRSPSSEAESCLTKVDGVNTPGADLIRCVAAFNQEGFTTPARMQSLMDAISNQTGASETLGMMASLAFKSEVTPALNVARAERASLACTNSGNKILTLFSSLGLMATACAGGDPAQSNAGALQGLMSSCMSSPTVAGGVGQAILNAYNQNCTDGGESNGETCTQLTLIVDQSGGNPATIAQNLAQCLESPPAPFCTGF